MIAPEELRAMAQCLMALADLVEAEIKSSETVCEILGLYARMTKREQAKARATIFADGGES